MSVILELFCVLLYIFMGAFFMGSAIRYFKKEEYFKFGIDTMLAIYNTILLIRITLFI